MVDERSSSPHNTVPLKPTGVSSTQQDNFFRAFGLEEKEVVFTVARKFMPRRTGFRCRVELRPVGIFYELFANVV